VDFVMVGAGVDASLTDASIMLMGPLSLVPGTVKADRGSAFFLNGASHPVVRFTANVDPVSAQSYGTIVILATGGGIASYTGGVVLLPQQ
jgi:hypothetical protein